VRHRNSQRQEQPDQRPKRKDVSRSSCEHIVRTSSAQRALWTTTARWPAAGCELLGRIMRRAPDRRKPIDLNAPQDAARSSVASSLAGLYHRGTTRGSEELDDAIGCGQCNKTVPPG
jgi:hypothetical protein